MSRHSGASRRTQVYLGEHSGRTQLPDVASVSDLATVGTLILMPRWERLMRFTEGRWVPPWGFCWSVRLGSSPNRFG
jgi:hypothetical protein